MDTFRDMVQKYTIKPDRIMKKICAPLAECLSIPVFIYFRIEPDGRFGHLSNYPENLDFFYSEQMFLDFQYFIHPSLLRSGCVLTSVANTPSDTEKIFKRFQISHLFIILQRLGASIEGYGFATKRSDSESNIDFFPKLDMMYKFVSFFKREAKSLIENMMIDSDNLATAKGEAFYHADPSLPLLNSDVNMHRFLKVTAPLSQREQQCLDLFKRGNSAQSTAAILGLSQRTVEHYLDHIKEKLECTSKWDLLRW